MASTSSPEAARQPDGNALATPAASSSTRPPMKVTPVPIPKPGLQPSIPGQVPHRSANPSVPPTVAQETVRNSATPAPSASAVRPNHDAVRPIIQDGRVRSPMPGKLKGKLDKKSGMFGVMLMAGPNTSDTTKRDAEAKRASESTQLAAEQALASGEGVTRRRKFVRLPPDPEPNAPMSNPTPAPPPPPASTVATAQPGVYGLTDAGIKAEQARLLTVLRSLNPVQVVDQVCTALAFFGGIPGAPPPPNGAFPPSAMANGSGRHFVSWIAEIFPPLPNYGPVAVPAHVDLTRETATAEQGARKRGRPKGSKSTRPRKDKGIKKGPVWARPDPAPKSKSGRPVGRPRKERPPAAANPGEESWVDVDQDEDEEDNEPSVADPEQAPAAASASATHRVSPSTRTALPSGSQAPDAESTPKRRGRPKGAKTRQPKATPAAGNVVSTSEGSQPPQTSPAQQLPPVPRFAPILQVATSPAVPQAEGHPSSFTPVNSASTPQIGAEAAAQPDLQSTKKRGKAKGPKPKAKANQTASVDGSNTEATMTDDTAGASRIGSASAAPASSGQRPYSQHVSTSATQPSQTITLTLPRDGPQTSTANPTAQPPVTAQKRKRKSKNASQSSISEQNDDTQAIAQQALKNTSVTLPNDTETSEKQQASQRRLAGTQGTSLAPPPAKRQRKTKDTKSNAKPNAKDSANASRNTDVQSSVTDTSAASDATRDSFGHSFVATTQASAQDSMSLDVDHALSSLHSPHDDTHFGVESPTMENYQAQLQAQLEQDLEPEPSPVIQEAAKQNRADSSHLMPNQLQQQQYQQNRYTQRQPQGQQSKQSGLQVSQSSAGHVRSPSHQQQVTKSQQEGPRPSQAALRASQNSFTQYSPTSVQYGKSQSYSPQQGTLQRTGQQYAAATQQQQQYNATQQQYNSGQSQYSGGGQQQGSAQPSYPQQLVTAAGTTSFNTTQSPQFASTNNGFNAADGSYRGSATSVNVNSPFNPLQRNLTASTASNGYRSASAQTRSPSRFDTTPISQSQHQQAGANTSSQSLQNSNLQSFAAGSNPSTGWDLFDTQNTAPNQSQNMTSYGIGGGGSGASARSAAPGGVSGFAHSAQSGLGGFDTSGMGNGNDRFYGVGRR